MRTNYTFGLFF